MGDAAKLTGVGASEGVAVGPVCAHVEELRSAKRVFDECREQLKNEGREIGA